VVEKPVNTFLTAAKISWYWKKIPAVKQQ